MSVTTDVALTGGEVDTSRVTAELARFERWIGDANSFAAQDAFKWLRDARALMKVRDEALALRVQAARLELRTLRRLGQLADDCDTPSQARDVFEGLRPVDRQSAKTLAAAPSKEFEAMLNWVSGDFATASQIAAWRGFQRQQQRLASMRTGSLPQHPNPRQAGADAADAMESGIGGYQSWRESILHIVSRIEVEADDDRVLSAARKLRRLIDPDDDAATPAVESAAEALAMVDDVAAAEVPVEKCSHTYPCPEHPKYVVYPDNGWVRVLWEEAGLDQFEAMVGFRERKLAAEADSVRELVELLDRMRVESQRTGLTKVQPLACLSYRLERRAS